MEATLFLLFVNLGFTFLHLLADLQHKRAKYIARKKETKLTKLPFLVRIMTIENLHFGGVQIRERKLWTIITASFEHDGYAHLVNNMIHFLGYASVLEAVIGGVRSDCPSRNACTLA